MTGIGGLGSDGIRLLQLGPSGRGVVAAPHWIQNQSSVALASATGNQAVWGKKLDVPSGVTYRVEGVVSLQTGNTSHNVSFGFATPAGAASLDLNSKIFSVFLNATINSTPASATVTLRAGGAVGVISPSSTATGKSFWFEGVIRTTSAGTLTPAIAFSAAPTGTNLVLPRSWMTITEMVTNDSSVNFEGSWT